MNATLARLSRFAADVSREPDGRLLDAFLGGSQPAFRELVERHGRLVFGVCNRVLRHRQDAEDAFQAVFLVLARRAADVWPRDAVGSWLYGVAHRVALKARTLRTRRQSREQALQEMVQPEQPAAEPDTADIVDRAVRKLPEVYRAAVLACDLEGLSRKDAAGQLGWTEGTLSGRLARARKLLADRLRKLGLSLPAGGLAAVLGTDRPLRAGLMDKVVDVVSGVAAVGVPAPLVALTQGVVPSMVALKLKAAAVAVVLACGLGYGAWAAGDGQGAGTGAGQPATTPKAETRGGPEPATPKKIAAGLEVLQGRWRVAKITSEGKEVHLTEKAEYPDAEISGNTLSLPYRDSSDGWRQEKHTIAVDPDRTPPWFDLITAGKPAGKGIYAVSGPRQMCASCHQPPTEDAIRGDHLALCAPALKRGTAKHTSFLKIAIATRGPRPEGFGRGAADGVVEFWLERVTPEGKDDREALTREKLRIEAVLAAAGGAVDQAEVQRLQARAKVIEAQLARDEANAQVYRANLDLALAQNKYALSQAQLERATKALKDAQDRLAAAEKAAADGGKQPPGQPVKDGETFTLHIRPLDAPEKVVWSQVNAQTVLDALGKAGDSVPLIRGPDGLSVWVVRDKAVMPVDLGGIVNRNETKTNYVLKAGDRLFVQVKLGK